MLLRVRGPLRAALSHDAPQVKYRAALGLVAVFAFLTIRMYLAH